jgi:hypothetical protein
MQHSICRHPARHKYDQFFRFFSSSSDSSGFLFRTTATHSASPRHERCTCIPAFNATPSSLVPHLSPRLSSYSGSQSVLLGFAKFSAIGRPPRALSHPRQCVSSPFARRDARRSFQYRLPDPRLTIKHTQRSNGFATDGRSGRRLKTTGFSSSDPDTCSPTRCNKRSQADR